MWYLCSINGGISKIDVEELSEALLEGTNCYLLDCGGEIYVWVGKDTELTDRKAASQTAEVHIICWKTVIYVVKIHLISDNPCVCVY